MFEYIYYSLGTLYENYMLDISIKYTPMIKIETRNIDNIFKEILFIIPEDLMSTIE